MSRPVISTLPSSVSCRFLSFRSATSLEPGTLEMVSLQAALRSNRPIDEAPEDLAWHTDHALVFAYPDPKLDGLPVRVPSGVLGKAEEHARLLHREPVLILFSSWLRFQAAHSGVV